jgi:hypothetical protein
VIAGGFLVVIVAAVRWVWRAVRRAWGELPWAGRGVGENRRK